jgi:hypothetical protein
MPGFRLGPKCKVEGCSRPVFKDGRCSPCWRSLRAFPSAHPDSGDPVDEELAAFGRTLAEIQGLAEA